MKKSEIFAKVVEIVSDCTEVSVEWIMSDRRQEDVVMARCLVIYYGRWFGLTVKHLQEYLNYDSSYSVRYMLKSYDERVKNDRYFRSVALYTGQEISKRMPKSEQQV